MLPGNPNGTFLIRNSAGNKLESYYHYYTTIIIIIMSSPKVYVWFLCSYLNIILCLYVVLVRSA